MDALLLHVTLSTGHIASTSRHDVDDRVIAMLASKIADDGGGVDADICWQIVARGRDHCVILIADAIIVTTCWAVRRSDEIWTKALVAHAATGASQLLIIYAAGGLSSCLAIARIR